ncbi:MAG: hypothetical protein CFE34_18855 [Rhodobacteraceae bacterium PARR1]|nr:MAG: hypothetical protein CFE34_18855 [Rhodobacteraceae bacterium PARR1]
MGGGLITTVGISSAATSGASADGLVGFAVNLINASFPVRVAIVAAMSCALGWTAAVVSDRLLQRKSDMHNLLGMIATICAAALLVAVAQAFSDMHSKSVLPQFNLMLLLGLGVALCMMRKNFEIAGRQSSPSIAQQRSFTMLIFGMGTLAIMAMTELAVL